MPTNAVMETSPFLRLCAGAAIAGGALRVADTFLAVTAAPRVQEIAYWATDVALALGLSGIYLAFRNELKIPGLLSFCVGVAGLLIVRGADAAGLGQNFYLVGASVTLIGVVALGAVLLARTSLSKLGPALWFASLLIGLLGLASAKMSWAVAVAGVLFGLGFVAVGWAVLHRTTATISDSL